MNRTFVVVVTALWCMNLFRDLLRLMLAWRGVLPWRSGLPWTWELWPSYVSLWEVFGVGICLYFLTYLWRMLEWKGDR